MEPPLWECAIAVQTDPNIFFHCRPVDGATIMATKLVVEIGDACWTFTGRVFHPAQRRPLNGHSPSLSEDCNTALSLSQMLCNG